MHDLIPTTEKVGGTIIFPTANVAIRRSLFAAMGAPERMLRWHYRSRHESLIAVSNREFYDGRLIVFPSPDAARRERGLVLRHLPEAVYDRGGTRTNPAAMVP